MHGITSMTHLPDYVTPQKAGEGRFGAGQPARAASPLMQQHTFQRNEKSLNWAFVDLTYISTAEMYVKSSPRSHATQRGPSPNAKGTPPCAARSLPRTQTTQLARPAPSPNAKGASGRLAGDPWKRMPIWKSPSYFTACLRAERTAASMALEVTVAPATPSMSAPWASSTCWA